MDEKELLETTELEVVEDSEITELRQEVMMFILNDQKPKATETIVNYILNKESIFTTRDDENAEMWVWKEGIYLPQARTYIQEYVRQIMLEGYTTHFCNQVISKIEADTYINQEEFFEENDPELIPVQNGVLNLGTRKLQHFDKDSPNFFFNKLPAEYKPEADCPKIKQFFNSTFKDPKDVEVIQEIFGYLLYKDYFLETAIMFLGEGRNGKGKTLMLMKKFIGIDNCAEVPLDELEKDIFSLGEVFKKMANLCGDLSKTALKNTGKFKKLTGRDMISAARKFKTRVKFVNYAKMVFSANELPITYDLTMAFFNRWIILQFPYTFLTQEEIDQLEEKENVRIRDPEIIDRISTPDEMSGLLNWAMEGLDRLRKNKRFSYSPSTEEVKQLWLMKSDSCQAFVTEHIEISYDKEIIKTDFRKNYVEYCTENKIKISTDKRIKQVLSNLGVYDGRDRIFGDQKSVWKGISWKQKVSKVSEVSKCILPYSKNGKFDIEVNTPPQLTHLTQTPKLILENINTVNIYQNEQSEEKEESDTQLKALLRGIGGECSGCGNLTALWWISPTGALFCPTCKNKLEKEGYEILEDLKDDTS